MIEGQVLPKWYDSINELAQYLGGPESISDLSAESIQRFTSVDLGGDISLHVLLDCLQNEAELSGVGAILARTEIIRALRSREFYLTLDRPSQSKPGEMLGVDQPAPLFIIGGARSGTSALLRFMSKWTTVRSPYTTEILCPETISREPPNIDLVRSVTIQDRLWDAIDSTFLDQHQNRGDLPSECLPVLNCGFQSHHWTGCYRVPTYNRHLVETKLQESLKYHKLFRGLLSSVSPEKILVFKSPAYALLVESLMSVYPNARFLYIHRDPFEVIHSYYRLLRTIRGMRSNRLGAEVQDFQDAVAHVDSTYDSLIDLIGKNVLHAENFYLIEYDRLLSDLNSVSLSICAWLGLSPEPLERSCLSTENRLGRLEAARQPTPAILDDIETMNLRRKRKELSNLWTALHI